MFTDEFYAAELEALKTAGNYRVFADLEKKVGTFPSAIYHDAEGKKRDVTVWCSNDYLGMGQSQITIEAMQKGLIE